MAVQMVTGGLRAQYADLYYHRVGDTIEWRAPNGYYSWWEFEYFYQHNIGLCVSCWDAIYQSPWFACSSLSAALGDSAIVLQRFFTPVPLKIIGVAGSVHQGEYFSLESRPSVTQEYFYVYDATPTGLVQVAEAPWNILDSHRTLHIISHNNTEYIYMNDPCCGVNRPRDEYIPIYEYYFDSAIYVTDSFYVGGSLYCTTLYPHPADSGVSTSYRMVSTPYSDVEGCDFGHISSYCRPLNFAFVAMGKDFNWGWGTRYYELYESNSSMFPSIIYPIIEVDTTVPPEDYCPQVGGLEVLQVDSGCVTVMWDDFPNYTSVMLQYGPVNVPFEDWTTVDIYDSTFYRICGLTTTGLYGVRIKALCKKKEASWSDRVTFYSSGTHDNTDDSTAVVPTVLSAYTFLSPNPAHGSTWVSSSFSLQNIDIYNAQGILVYSEHATGHRYEVHLDGLPAGTYIMVITTFNGTTHKKMVIK